MDQALSPAHLQQRRRRLLAAWVGGVLALLVGLWALNRWLSPSVSLSDLRVAEVRKGSIANTVNATGLVIPVREELLTSPIATRLLKVHAKAGQQVQAGELLLTLDSPTVQLAIDTLKEQIAQADNKAVLLAQELNQKHKQTLSAIELLDLDQQSAQVKWDRYRDQRDTGTIAKNDLMAAELAVQRIAIQLRQQRELIDDMRRTTQSQIEGARLQAGVLKKQLAQQELLLAQTQVRAPFSGLLSWMVSDEGASLTSGQLLARVSAPNNFGIEASLSDMHARALAAGQAVRVVYSGQTLLGRVQTVLPEVQNGSIKLMVALDEPSHPALRPKLRVDVNIVTEEKARTMVVAQGPALNGRGRQAVFVLRGGMAERTEVQIGAGDGQHVEVLSGAQAGDQLIVSDMSRFKDRERLRVAP
jgi:HlyD family secretion protein